MRYCDAMLRFFLRTLGALSLVIAYVVGWPLFLAGYLNRNADHYSDLEMMGALALMLLGIAGTLGWCMLVFMLALPEG